MTATWAAIPATRRRMMSAVRSKHTKPELLVRRLLHGLGYRYRLHRRDLPGGPDVVFPSRRRVIEIRGCFWHQHPGCKAASMPRTRREWWEAKLTANVDRDARNLVMLREMGWRVLIVWECELGDRTELAKRLVEFLGLPGRAVPFDLPPVNIE